MKNYLFIGIIAFMCSCTSQYNDELSNHETHETEAVKELTLNNGQKWNSDDNTNSNVAAMQEMAERFSASEKKSTDEFKSFALELQGGLNKMIEECKMSGPDHDALHTWLEPLLMEDIQLQKISNESEGMEIFHSIEVRLSNYNNYFE